MNYGYRILLAVCMLGLLAAGAAANDRATHLPNTWVLTHVESYSAKIVADCGNRPSC